MANNVLNLAECANLWSGEYEGACHLVLLRTEDGIWHLDTHEREADDAVRGDIYFGRCLEIGIKTLHGVILEPGDADAIAGWIDVDGLIPLLERIDAGHSVEWDGSNYVGVLTDDATDARMDIRTRCEIIDRDGLDIPEAWTADLWLGEVEIVDDMTGESLQKEAIELQDIRIFGGAKALQEVVDTRKAEAEAEAAEDAAYAAERDDEPAPA